MKKKVGSKKKAVLAKVHAAPQVSEAPADNGDGLVHTGVDALVELVKRKKKISLRDAAKAIKFSTDVVEDWASILEEEGILTLEYTFMNTFLVLAGAAKKEPGADKKKLRGTLLTKALDKEKQFEKEQKLKKEKLSKLTEDSEVVLEEHNVDGIELPEYQKSIFRPADDVQLKEEKVTGKEIPDSEVAIGTRKKPVQFTAPEQKKVMKTELPASLLKGLQTRQPAQQMQAEEPVQEKKSFFSNFFKKQDREQEPLDVLSQELAKELALVKQEEELLKKQEDDLKKQVDTLNKKNKKAVSDEEEVKKRLKALAEQEKKDIRTIRLTGAPKSPVINVLRSLTNMGVGRKIKGVKKEIEMIDRELLNKIEEVKGVEQKDIKKVDSSLHAEIKKINDYLVSLRELQKHQQNEIHRLRKKAEVLDEQDSQVLSNVDRLKNKKGTKFTLFQLKSINDKALKGQVQKMARRQRQYESEILALKSKISEKETTHQEVKKPVLLKTLKSLASANVSAGKPTKDISEDIPVPLPIQKNQLLKEVEVDPDVKGSDFLDAFKGLFGKSKEPAVYNFKSFENLVENTDKAISQRQRVEEGLTRSKIKSLRSKKKKLRTMLKKMDLAQQGSPKDRERVLSEIDMIDETAGGKL